MDNFDLKRDNLHPYRYHLIHIKSGYLVAQNRFEELAYSLSLFLRLFSGSIFMDKSLVTT